MMLAAKMDVGMRFVINLDRSVSRLERFREINSSSQYIQRSPAVDGAELDRARLVAHNVVTADLDFTDRSIGNALSHLSLWRDATFLNRPITIFEDDAILAQNFDEESARLIESISGPWDYIAWGWNFDARMTFDMLPGYSPCCAVFDQNSLRIRATQFSKETIPSSLFPLMGSFGTIGYSISPAGAHKLIDYCLPLRNMLVTYTGYSSPIPAGALDQVVSSAFSQISAFVAVPPIVITENDTQNSTVWVS